MADVTQFLFSYKEIVEALIRKQGIREGIWQLYLEFSIGAANIPQGPDQNNLMPAAIIPVSKIGLLKVEKENNLAVDAAKLTTDQK